ncbi:hypothetical protein AVEN_268305-1 [Araneus ventricosus]|uniref:Uncharacterized protein n=1 Tax=Araneus ventricosus TaxID=182803 RepID=A0A4Y2N5U8_ARAVE|nr:hypothetical protein AVEN_268305-1 [Araneus ventricosus]
MVRDPIPSKNCHKRVWCTRNLFRAICSPAGILGNCEDGMPDPNPNGSRHNSIDELHTLADPAHPKGIGPKGIGGERGPPSTPKERRAPVPRARFIDSN